MIELLQSFIGIIITIVIGLVLFYASIEDLRHRTIRNKWVISLYILVCINALVTNSISTQSTFVFLFTFILFMGIAVFSFGRFGIGDAMVLGALGWFYHDFASLQHFLYIMGATCLPWAVFCVLYYGRNQGILNAIKGFKRHINIDEARPGMVLASDNFMHGLTQVQIDDMRHAGFVTIDVKQPFPFIPVIFIAYVISIII